MLYEIGGGKECPWLRHDMRIHGQALLDRAGATFNRTALAMLRLSGLNTLQVLSEGTFPHLDPTAVKASQMQA